MPRFRKKRAPSQAGGSCSLQREGSTASCQPASRTVAFPSLPSLVIDHKALPPMKGFRAKAGPGTLSAGVREQSPAGPTMSLTQPCPTSSRPPSAGSPALATPSRGCQRPTLPSAQGLAQRQTRSPPQGRAPTRGRAGQDTAREARCATSPCRVTHPLDPRDSVHKTRRLCFQGLL